MVRAGYGDMIGRFHARIVVVLLACGDEEKQPKVADCTNPESTAEYNWDCDPIDPSRCILPFPSTFFMEETDQTASGWQVALGETTIPKTSTWSA